jgi:pimeloyl-ACP methyl ester carboxylesterase
MTEKLSIAGVDVHVDGRCADTIVMVHGWPDTYRLWDAQVEALRSQHRCVRFTLPGFDIGESRRAVSLDQMIDVLRQVVEHTSGGSPVIMLLHDWGCFFGYQYVLRHPSTVARVIGVDIGDAGSRRHLREMNAKQKAMMASYQLWLALAWRIGGSIGDRMTRSMARQLKCPGDPRSIHSGMCYPYDIRWTGSHGGFRHVRPFESPCPMLYIYGTRKPFMFHSQTWADALAAKPGNRVLGFRTGHWVMCKQPQAFNEAVLTWLADQS